MHRQNLLYHSVFQLVPVSHSSYEELVHVLLSQAVWNLEATGVSNFVSGNDVRITILEGGRVYSSSISVCWHQDAWLGCGPSQSYRGLSAIAASYVPVVVAGSAPGECVPRILSLSSCSPS